MINKKNFEVFYNTSSFKFFRRQFNSEDKEKGLVDYIKIKDKKNFKNFNLDKNRRGGKLNLSRNTKKFNPEFLFQAHSLEGVDKIRDLFLEFDYDKSLDFDVNELFAMFNSNFIPISKKELAYIFDLSKRKKYITFNELMEKSDDNLFLEKFKKVIENVKKRCSPDIICPSNFIDMLIHLREFRKLSNTVKKLEDKINKLDEYHTQTLNEKITIKEENNKYKRFQSWNIPNTYEGQNTRSKDFLKKSYNFSDLKSQKDNDAFDKKEKHNMFKSITKTFKKAIDIGEQKLLKSKETFSINNREVNLKRIKTIYNSIRTIHNYSPKIQLDYFSFNNIENTFSNADKGNKINLKSLCNKINNKKIEYRNCNKCNGLIKFKSTEQKKSRNFFLPKLSKTLSNNN